MGTIIGIIEPHKVAFFAKMTAINGIFRRLHSSDSTSQRKAPSPSSMRVSHPVIEFQIKELGRRMESPSVEELKLDPTAPQWEPSFLGQQKTRRSGFSSYPGLRISADAECRCPTSAKGMAQDSSHPIINGGVFNTSRPDPKLVAFLLPV